MTNDEIMKLIQERYPDTYHEDAFQSKLEEMIPGIRQSLESFLKNGNLEDISVLGHSVTSLMQKRKMNEVAAYMTIDWLLKKPEEALKSLNNPWQEKPPVFSK